MAVSSMSLVAKSPDQACRELPQAGSHCRCELQGARCAAGRVFGLHSGDGRQLWSLSYPPTVRLAHAALWRTSHDTATPPQVLLLGSTQDGHTFYSVLDAHHGVPTSEGTLPYPVSQVGLHRLP